MLVQTRRFGPLEDIEVPASQLYEFFPGLGGFEDHHHYAVIADADSPVEWLQSTSDPNVVFALLEPFVFAPDYSFEMADADAAALGLQRPEDAVVRTILTLRDSAASITANLMAPIVLNPRTRLGRQIVLQETELSLRFPVLEGLHSHQSEAGASDDDQEVTARSVHAA
jgi:flagellar assembly factor FliW